MKPLVPGQPTDKSVKQTRLDFLERYDRDPEFAAKLGSDRDAFIAQVESMIALAGEGEHFVNDVYHVIKMPIADDWVHLSIKRHDRKPIHDWRDLQAIKNQLCGDETEGCELMPAESRKVDSSNQYHLWVCTDPTYRFPFGFTERLVIEDPPGKAKNRRFSGGFAK